jgi:hypothetical protein
MHLFSLSGGVEEEVILYEKAYIKRLMLKKLHDLKKQEERKCSEYELQREMFNGFAQHLIERHYHAPLEEKPELMNLAKRVIFLKGECNKQSNKLADIVKQVDPIIRRCQNSPDCSVFEKEYEQLQSAVNSNSLDDEIRLITSHQLYRADWRHKNEFHCNTNSFTQ